MSPESMGTRGMPFQRYQPDQVEEVTLRDHRHVAALQRPLVD